MDAAGRKILLAGGYAIAAVFCALMTASLNLKDEISWMSYLSIASVIGFIIGFAIGPGTMTDFPKLLLLKKCFPCFYP